MRLGVAIAMAATLVLVACSGESNSGDGGTEATSLYAVLRDEAWQLQEGIDPPGDALPVDLEQPPVNWYAEYDEAGTSRRVRLSGHEASLERSRAELKDLGFDLRTVELEAWSGVGGSAPGDPASPAVLLLDGGPTTFMALSYDLSRHFGIQWGVIPASRVQSGRPA